MKLLGIKALVCTLTLLLCAVTTRAAGMNPFSREGRTRAETLIITGNFREPRLIAELAQYRTKQPILIIAPDGYGNHSLFFMPSGTKPMTETADNFSGILALINPRRVVVLGGSDFVPAQFVDIAQKKYPVILLPNADMEVVAHTLGDLMSQPKLKTDFLDYRKRLKMADEALHGSNE